MNKRKNKKSRVIIPVVIGVVAVCAFFLINPIRSLIAIKTMNPLESQEVMTGIYAINNEYVNLYLFKIGDTYIAFDAGVDNETTKSALDSYGIDVNDVSAVFLTHTDYDHVAALTLFPSAKVYMADSNKVFLFGNTGRSRSKGFVDMVREYSTMLDDEAITISDIQIRCIFTPGHTDGSASYVINNKYLFTGDNLNLKNGSAVLFNAVFNMNGDEQVQSLRKLSRLDGIEAVFAMHTGYTTDFKTAFSQWGD